MKVKVLAQEYWKDCVAIWGSHNGQDLWISYEQVEQATLVSSDREDGYETLLLTDGRQVLVQSIDLDYL
jgi:hypothetical protein